MSALPPRRTLVAVSGHQRMVRAQRDRFATASRGDMCTTQNIYRTCRIHVTDDVAMPDTRKEPHRYRPPMGLSVKCLGSRPAVGKRIQVYAEAFDAGYFPLRDVVTKSFAV